MPTLWDDRIRNRNPRQLMIFVAPRLSKTKPDPDGDGGADVQFDMGKGDLTYTALGAATVVKGYSGTSMHGNTQLVSLKFDDQTKRIQRAFVFVPETPMVNALMQVGRGKFNQ